jgi:catechol 2,3-dioxygenase
MAWRLLSQLAHVEFATPKPEETLRFLTDLLGLYESGREGQSVFLRGWGEWFHHSLVVTEGPQPALGHIGWRAEGPEALELAAQRLAHSGLGEGWHDGSTGHGAAYRFRGPGGQLSEVFWEVERWQAPPELASTYPNRPQRFMPRGAGVG